MAVTEIREKDFYFLTKKGFFVILTSTTKVSREKGVKGIGRDLRGLAVYTLI